MRTPPPRSPHSPRDPPAASPPGRAVRETRGHPLEAEPAPARAPPAAAPALTILSLPRWNVSPCQKRRLYPRMKPTLRDVNSKPGLHTSEPYPKIHTGCASSAPPGSPGTVAERSGAGGSGRSSRGSGSRFMARSVPGRGMAGRFKGRPGRRPRPRPARGARLAPGDARRAGCFAARGAERARVASGGRARREETPAPGRGQGGRARGGSRGVGRSVLSALGEPRGIPAGDPRGPARDPAAVRSLCTGGSGCSSPARPAPRCWGGRSRPHRARSGWNARATPPREPAPRSRVRLHPRT